MEFSRSEYWSGYPFPSPGDLPNPGTEPRSPTLPEDSLPDEPQGKPTSSLLAIINCSLYLRKCYRIMGEKSHPKAIRHLSAITSADFLSVWSRIGCFLSLEYFFLTRRIKIAIFFTVLTLSRVCWAVYCILDLTHTHVCVCTHQCTPTLSPNKVKGLLWKWRAKSLITQDW